MRKWNGKIIQQNRTKRQRLGKINKMFRNIQRTITQRFIWIQPVNSFNNESP
jgi:hypothetical protein